MLFIVNTTTPDIQTRIDMFLIEYFATSHVETNYRTHLVGIHAENGGCDEHENGQFNGYYISITNNIVRILHHTLGVTNISKFQFSSR